jgi:hypothetical protein
MADVTHGHQGRSNAMRLFRRISASGVLAVAALLALGACNFGSQGQVGAQGTTNGVFLTSRNFTVRLVSMPAVYRDGAAWALTNQYAPTDLIVSFASTTTCPATVRSCVLALNYGPNGLNGWNACFKDWSGRHPNMFCGQARTRINRFYAPPPRAIACHEIGHSTGLRHTGDTSCMNVRLPVSRLSAHDRQHLNDHY